jgi:hypothetical protein
LSLLLASENGDLLDDGVRRGNGLLMSAAAENGDLLEDRVRGGMTFSITTRDLDGEGGGGGGSLRGDRVGASMGSSMAVM